MARNAATGLYAKFHADRGDERIYLFSVLVDAFDIATALYPGCFVHVAPSFVIPEVVYVDSDRRARQFFDTGRAAEIVHARKRYDTEPAIRFIQQDYATDLDIRDDYFDLLVSQYAGPISLSCTHYVRHGGYLVANNSHGDAGIAECSEEMELVAVVNRRGERFTLSTTNLDAYFVPKSITLPDDPAARRAYLVKLGRGVGYVRSAFGYVFRRR